MKGEYYGIFINNTVKTIFSIQLKIFPLYFLKINVMIARYKSINFKILLNIMSTRNVIIFFQKVKIVFIRIYSVELNDTRLYTIPSNALGALPLQSALPEAEL